MDILEKCLLIIPPLLVAMVLHEAAHAYVAYLLGDPTAKQKNRVNLNPLVHIDPVWTVLVPAILIFSGSPFVFGAAKPVPVDPRYFKNPRQGMMLVAVAGPVINMILAILCFASYKLFVNFASPDFYFAELFVNWFAYGLMINLVLALFNLIPVPPLDGGRIMVGLLPLNLAIKYAQLEKYGFLLIILLIVLEIPEKILSPILEWAMSLLG